MCCTPGTFLSCTTSCPSGQHPQARISLAGAFPPLREGSRLGATRGWGVGTMAQGHKVPEWAQVLTVKGLGGPKASTLTSLPHTRHETIRAKLVALPSAGAGGVHAETGAAGRLDWGPRKTSQQTFLEERPPPYPETSRHPSGPGTRSVVRLRADGLAWTGLQLAEGRQAWVADVNSFGDLPAILIPSPLHPIIFVLAFHGSWKTRAPGFSP